MKTEENDITGIWYSDEYLMAIENGKVCLNTNIDTPHKPFYTQNIFDEALTLTYESDNLLRISAHIVAPGYAIGKEIMAIFIELDRLIPVRLVKFTND